MHSLTVFLLYFRIATKRTPDDDCYDGYDDDLVVAHYLVVLLVFMMMTVLNIIVVSIVACVRTFRFVGR